MGAASRVFGCATKKPPSPPFRRDESLNFRGTTLIGISMPAPGISTAPPRESRLFGNGEETRFRLNRKVSAEILEGQ